MNLFLFVLNVLVLQLLVFMIISNIIGVGLLF